MADRLVHLTGIAKREAEQMLGRELKPAGPEGDLFHLPEEVAAQLGNMPPSPPKAEDSQRVKDAVRALPLESEASEKVKNEDGEGGSASVEDVVGPEVQPVRR
jgi:hypothetical protein